MVRRAPSRGSGRCSGLPGPRDPRQRCVEPRDLSDSPEETSAGLRKRKEKRREPEHAFPAFSPQAPSLHGRAMRVPVRPGRGVGAYGRPVELEAVALGVLEGGYSAPKFPDDSGGELYVQVLEARDRLLHYLVGAGGRDRASVYPGSLRLAAARRYSRERDERGAWQKAATALAVSRVSGPRAPATLALAPAPFFQQLALRREARG